MHIKYGENTEEVRATLRRNIEKQKFLKNKYKEQAEGLKKGLVRTHNTLSHVTAVLKMMEEDLAELEATKED